MRKIFIILRIFALFCFVLGSCVSEVVTYCPFCGKSSIEEISEYNMETGVTKIFYKCNNPECGKTFGASQL